MTFRNAALAVSSSLALATVGAAAQAQQSEADHCSSVELAQVNWPGVSAKTGTLAWMLGELGYETDVVTGGVEFVFQAIANGERDAFLGLWLPTQRGQFAEHGKDGNIDLITQNLSGAKYTVAVNEEAWQEGVRHFEDLAEYADRFDNTIYGIESGNDGNLIIESMIEDNAYGLGDAGFQMQPSSTAGMLSEVGRRHDNDQWAAHLAWRPHPMNVQLDIRYLRGGEDYWGPERGLSNVYSIMPNGENWQCPNVAQLIESFEFELAEQDQLVNLVQNEDMSFAEAGQAMMQENPELIDRWTSGGTYQITGVYSRDGEPADEVLRAALGLNDEM